jgi:hypothetical protein
MTKRLMRAWKAIMETANLKAQPAAGDRRGSRTARDLDRRTLGVESLESRKVLATFVVTHLADSGSGSLRAAVESANAQAGADVISFRKGLTGSIFLTSGSLPLTGQLAIEGPGASRLTVSGNKASRVFTLDSSATQVSIRNLRIADGRHAGQENVGIVVTRGGAILNDGGNLLLDNVRMENNVAINDRNSANPSRVVGGGAIANSTGAKLTVTRSTFRDNVASGGVGYSFGGAIASVTNSLLSIDRSDFRGNVTRGGAVNYGGAVANFGSSSMTVNRTKMEENKALGLLDGDLALGGAIAASRGTVNTQGSTTLIQDSTLRRNTAQAGLGADAGGGAIYNYDSMMLVSRTKIEENLALGGEGDNLTDGGDAYGGGIFNEQSDPAILTSLRLMYTEIAENLARGGRGREGGRALGGGIFNGSVIPNPLVLPVVQATRTTIQDNVAKGGASRVASSPGAGIGGGIYTTGPFSVDSFTQKALGRGSHSNEASTEADNVFGTLTPTGTPK